MGQGLSVPKALPTAPGPLVAEAAIAAPEGVTPPYWDEACRHLAKRDRVMKKLIPKFGEARLQSRGDAFTTLARSIMRPDARPRRR